MVWDQLGRWGALRTCVGGLPWKNLPMEGPQKDLWENNGNCRRVGQIIMATGLLEAHPLKAIFCCLWLERDCESFLRKSVALPGEVIKSLRWCFIVYQIFKC
uniref:Uncharacterized protein n=1 Tax=Pongo abelii TaxID=9601 RepID=A0A8I5TYN0_PONAB